jgi:hypothetical protein
MAEMKNGGGLGSNIVGARLWRVGRSVERGLWYVMLMSGIGASWWWWFRDMIRVIVMTFIRCEARQRGDVDEDRGLVIMCSMDNIGAGMSPS